jgi:ribosomal protein S18 acetylase RimI-like enzyme
MVVRAADTVDIEAVAVLFDQYRTFYGKPTDIGLARAFIGERMHNAESVVLVAEAADGALAGFVQLYPGFSSVSAARIYVLNDLFVTHARRCQGIGRLLLEAAHRFGQQAGAVYLSLSTAIGNHSAQALYESLGWTRDREFYHYALAVGSGPRPGKTA